MSKKQKILAIANDVLAQLRAKKLKVKLDEGYVVGKYPVELVQLGSQLQSELDGLQPACTVCALGSCFLSYARLFNHVKVGECGQLENTYSTTWMFDLNYGQGRRIFQEIMGKIFSETQLGLIELAFEAPDESEWFVFNFTKRLPSLLRFNEPYDDEPKPTGKGWELVKLAHAFGRKYKSGHSRLKAIMENIIANDGKFIPPPKKNKNG